LPLPSLFPYTTLFRSEALATVQLVQAFGREGYEVERFDTESAEYRKESMRNARIEAVASRTVEIIGAIGTCAVVLIGSWQVLQRSEEHTSELQSLRHR